MQTQNAHLSKSSSMTSLFSTSRGSGSCKAVKGKRMEALKDRSLVLPFATYDSSGSAAGPRSALTCSAEYVSSASFCAAVGSMSPKAREMRRCSQ